MRLAGGGASANPAGAKRRWNRRRANGPVARRYTGSLKKAYRWKRCQCRVKGPRNARVFCVARARLVEL